jgi:hypothetical protein
MGVQSERPCLALLVVLALGKMREEMKSEKKQKAVSTSKSRVERRCDKRQTRRDWTLGESGVGSREMGSKLRERRRVKKSGYAI